MAKILGLGGVFFKCDSVAEYRDWWRDTMGMNVSEWGSTEFPNTGEGYTVFGPFKGDTDYFSPSKLPFMINLRVDDVQALLEKAKAGGAEIVDDVQVTEQGTFGWFIDPAGIKIELWALPT